MSKGTWSAKKIAFIAIFIAIGIIFEILASLIFRMPQGGSVSLVMLPLVIIGYKYDVKTTIMSGILIGILQGIFIPPIFVSFVQYLLDYVLAFGFLGLGCIFIKNKDKRLALKLDLGILLSYALRYISHVISGAIYFGEYAGNKQVILYSMAYSATTLLTQLIVALVLCPLVILLLKKAKVL